MNMQTPSGNPRVENVLNSALAVSFVGAVVLALITIVLTLSPILEQA